MIVRHNKIRGRGAQHNPVNRFLRQETEPDPEQLSDPAEAEALLQNRPETEYLEVFPKSIINRVESPDLADYSLNPYQGCEHGCVYCYARNTHEYWGFSAGIDFESRIMVKKNAAELLRKELGNPKWKPSTIMLAGNTDIYQPAERKFGITRQLLEVFDSMKHPVGLITKNSLIERDIDILARMASEKRVLVNISLTTLDESLKRILEPRTSSSLSVLRTIRKLSDAGIPVQVLNAPVIPSLNDHEVFDIAKAAAEAGARDIHYIVVRLNGKVSEIFGLWLRQAFPDRASRILKQVSDIHGGSMSDSRFGIRMKGEGKWAEMIGSQQALARKKFFGEAANFKFDFSLFNPGSGKQLSLF
jgi:DNA repair photolyase